jgi:hypothetical protein
MRRTESSLSQQEHADETVFVYLCSGDVEPVSPADSVSVHDNLIEVSNHGSLVITYDRSKVYYCSRVQTPPFLT